MEEEWIIDSGSCDHLALNPALFKHAISIPFESAPSFFAANGSELKATHFGVIGSPSDKIFVEDVFLVPGLTENLISVSQLCTQGARVTFSSSGCIIEDSSTGQVLGRGHKCYNRFCLDELNMSCLEGTERRPQMPPAMPGEANSSNWEVRDDASSGANSEVNIEVPNIENVVIQPLEVPNIEKVSNIESTLIGIESELMDDQTEISFEDSSLIDLEICQHDLWSLANN